jgi:hypothetical protein
VLTAEKSTSQRGSWATSSPKGRNPQNLFCGSHWGGPYSGASLLPSFSVQRSYSYRQIWHFFPNQYIKSADEGKYILLYYFLRAIETRDNYLEERAVKDFFPSLFLFLFEEERSPWCSRTRLCVIVYRTLLPSEQKTVTRERTWVAEGTDISIKVIFSLYLF